MILGNLLIHLEGSRLHGISYTATFGRMIKGDCFTPKYEDFELEEENKPEESDETERESGTFARDQFDFEKNKVDESTTAM